jgi:hypothetical protein
MINKAILKPFVFMNLKQELNFLELFKFIPLNISSESEMTGMNKIMYK